MGSRNLTVRRIGRFRAPGNIGTHTLRIAQVASPYQECAAVLDTKTAPVDALGFQYASLQTPCVLAASQQYRVTSEEVSGGDYWYDYENRMTTESDATVTGGTYRDLQGDHDLADPGRGYVPVNFVYDGQKLVSSVTTEGAVRTDTGQSGMTIKVGSKDLYVWRLGRYFLEDNNQAHTLGLYVAPTPPGGPFASVNVPMSSTGGSVDELGFKYATLSGATRLSRSTSYYFSSVEQGPDTWLNLDTAVVTPGNKVNPVYFDGSMWHDVTDYPGQSYGPLNAVYEPLNRVLPCQPPTAQCYVVSNPRQTWGRQGMRITVPAGETITVTDIGSLFFTGNHNDHTLSVYDANGALRASVTINVGTALLADDGFKYGLLSSPALLTPGDYYVTDESWTTPPDTFADHTTTVVPGSDVSNVFPAYFDGLQWTTLLSEPNQSYGPMNLIYYVKTTP